MSSVLARLQGETQRLREHANRKIFVSSDTVQAYRVAHERKELLTREHPLILAVPDDFSSSSSSSALSMIDASVGPDLKWTLTSINHILRTVSKFGEPTYLFANILDNDPQAFVAVTLRKGTPVDELEHLDSVLGRVSQLHVAEKKPKQVPDAGDVVNALGKGLMGLLGISSGNKQQQQQQRRRQEEQQHKQEEADRVSAAAARDTAAARAAGAGLGVRVNVHGRPADAGDEFNQAVPSATVTYGGSSYQAPTTTSSSSSGSTRQEGHQRPALGVTDRKQAESRLAALKAEMAREGAPPSAPDVHAAPDDTTSNRLYTPTAAAAPHTYQQQQQRGGNWESRTPGVLSNPYSTSTDSDSYRTGRGGGYDYATAGDSDILLNTEPYGGSRAEYDKSAGGKFYPSIPTDIIEDRPLPGYKQGYSSSSRDEEYARDKPGHDYVRGYQAPGGGSYNSPAGYEDYVRGSGSTNAPKPGERGYEDYLRQLQRRAQGSTAASGAPDLTDRGAYDKGRDYVRESGRDYGVLGNTKGDYGSALQQEAEEARKEWERTQRETAAAAAARDDGGWGAGPNRREQQQQQQQRKKDAPNWLEVLGTVFSGGPAYQTYAPDL